MSSSRAKGLNPKDDGTKYFETLVNISTTW